MYIHLSQTVEVISVILGNPRPPAPGVKVASGDSGSGSGSSSSSSSSSSSGGVEAAAEAGGGKLRSRATLIVVPPTLVGQWWRELHQRVDQTALDPATQVRPYVCIWPPM